MTPGRPLSVVRSLLLAILALATSAAPAAALPWAQASRTDYAVAGGPEWSTVADLNNDGHRDIVTANLLTDNVSVLLNNGSGGYLPKNDYPAGDGPFTVAAFDLNSDNFQDLVVANYFAGTISVLMGNGTGAFNSKVDHASGANCAVAAIGWFNGDYFADIVTANYGANNVSVFLGDGAGGFTSKTDFAVGLNPNWVAVGDLDGDAVADLVSANFSGNSISVLTGDGYGGFSGLTHFAVGNGPLTLTLDYFNADNVLDVATANWSDNTMTVRLGNGSGGFGAPTTLATGNGPVTVDSGDLNLDGLVDLAVCNDGSASVSVLVGNGNGTFQPKFDLAVGSAPYAVAIGDVTNDGEPDLVACNFGSNSISVLKGNVPGGFAVNDTLPGLTARDKDNVLRSLSDHLGKWLVVDLTAVWCPPCNFAASEAREVSDTWSTYGLPFEYVMVLVDGPQPNRTATQANATNWATKYQLLDDVLHGEGLRASVVRSWMDAVRTNAYPTLLIVDPAGTIRYMQAGALTGQALVDSIAAYAGISPSPPLAGSPPPPPPPPPPAPPRWSWQAIQGSSYDVAYGNASSSGTLTDYSDPPNWTSSILAGGLDLPGLTDGVVQIQCAVDSTTGTESIDLIVGSTSFQPIPTASDWSIAIENIQWPDGAPRELAPDHAPVVYAIYGDEQNSQFFDSGLEVTVLLQGNDLGTSRMFTNNVVGLPGDTWALYVTGIKVRHQFPVASADGGRGSVLSLAPPQPNPSRGTTTLRWAMATAGRAELFVTDLAGRRVRTLQAGAAAAGEHATAWDLRDDAGSRVAPGLYFVRLAVPGQPSRSTRMVVLQ